eukprot:9195612-Pyramimonas_sp.AAC.1
MDASPEEAQHIDNELKRISQEQRLLRRKASRALQSQLVAEATDLWNHRKQAEAMRVARRAARTRIGPKKRDGLLVRTAAPTSQAWLDVWSLEGSQGGMAVQPQDWLEWRAE